MASRFGYVAVAVVRLDMRLDGHDWRTVGRVIARSVGRFCSSRIVVQAPLIGKRLRGA